MAVDYWSGFLRRRWVVLVTIFGLIAIIAAFLALREYTNRPYTSSVQFFVSAVPSLSGTKLVSPGIVSYEGEARLAAMDLTDVAQSMAAATDVSNYLRVHHLGYLSPTQVQGIVTVSSSGRVVTISDTRPSAHGARLVADAETFVGTTWRGRYEGGPEARRTDVKLISLPNTVRAATGGIALTLLVRLIVAAIVAFAVALAWDYLDDTVRDPEDLERWLGTPVLARVS